MFGFCLGEIFDEFEEKEAPKPLLLLVLEFTGSDECRVKLFELFKLCCDLGVVGVEFLLFTLEKLFRL